MTPAAAAIAARDLDADGRARLEGLVRRHGWNATAAQVLEPGFRALFVDEHAAVAFVDTGSAWVAAGAPMCDEGRLGEIADAFVAAAARAKRRAVFFATERRFARATQLRSELIGLQPVWSPQRWPEVLRAKPRLREQLRRARSHGVTVRAVDGAELAAATPLRAAVEALVVRWRRFRDMEPMGFLARVDPLFATDGARWLVAERRTEGSEHPDVVGLLALSPVFGRRGWLGRNLLRAPEAPNGTVEALVDGAMRAARAEGVAIVTLGLAPLAGPVRRSLRWAARAGAGLYDFDGLRAFKARLSPDDWDPIYVSFPRRGSLARSLADALLAFAQGRPTRFALRTLARGPRALIVALAWLLVPWTIALAIAPPTPWFASRAIQLGWVAYDVALTVALNGLRRRWRSTLAATALVLTAADAIGTALHLLLVGPAWGALGWGGRSLVVTGLAGPTISTALIARARRRLSQARPAPTRAPRPAA